ncbi:hypothetical protein Amet_0328 [Alkaliphilus metalliredigens QYMF]|uniref:Thioredoxin-like fold domain-containing protein n=1 Tax=Alkaliphilus metalliredigens (strain QYMF) TaxID=293826 RepID=A6TK40_ALKMQ|nr:hypothetical protein [Alkaliphilus metalliredigens]ABR46558.1 hypothetical protein Amet_0328 [Alkaliphilus metalliredigens QYMF]
MKDLEEAIIKAGLEEKVELLHFIDAFSDELDQYPQIVMKIENMEIGIPAVCFGEEVIVEDKIDIEKIVQALKELS